MYLSSSIFSFGTTHSLNFQLKNSNDISFVDFSHFEKSKKESSQVIHNSQFLNVFTLNDDFNEDDFDETSSFNCGKNKTPFQKFNFQQIYSNPLFDLICKRKFILHCSIKIGCNR